MWRVKGKKLNNLYVIILSTIAAVFVIVAIVSIFFTSKISELKKEQLNFTQSTAYMEETDFEYLRKENQFDEITELIGQNVKIKNLLSGLSRSSKALIVSSIPSGYPVNLNRVTSSFGYRMHPIYKKRKFHHGIDFGGKSGTPIVATADGIVAFSGYDSGYGNFVRISHNFGFKTAYGHMLKKLKVKKGDFIKKGDVIGYLGNSGVSTGPHLHYEIKYLNSSLDPKNFLTFNEKNFETLFSIEKHVAWDSLIWAITSQYSKVGLARLY